MSAADARGPAIPAARATASAGNRASSGARKSRRPAATRSAAAAGDGGRSGYVRAYWMGSRMSGVPSWALREPSRKRTAEWTTLCGWITTSIASYPTSYSQCASMTSSPLFARVAESIVILAPMVHVGWRRAWSGVTPANVEGSRSRNGPPDAVRISAATSASDSPARHCQSAECSESIGRSQASGLAAGSRASVARTAAARARASGITRCPPATSVSLLAVATTVPARNAARTGRRLTTPPVATTTRSTSSRAASSLSASASPPRSVEGAPKRAAWSARSAAFAPAASATSSNRSGWAASTSRVCVPMLPVEPSRTTRPGAPGPRSGKKGHHVQGHDRCREEERIDPVEHAAVARDEGTGILRAGRPLQDRFGQVARLRDEGGQRTQDEPMKGRLAEPPEQQRDDDRRRDHPTGDALEGLRWRDVGQERVPADLLADEVGAGVVRPDRQDEQQDPSPLRPERPERCRRGDRRRHVAEPDDEREEADVQRAEDRRHPCAQAVSRLRLEERCDRDQDDPDGDEQQAAALEDLGEGGIEDHGEREHGPEGRQRPEPRAAQQLEDLASGERRQDGDGEREHDPAHGEDDEQDRDQDDSADRTLTHGLSFGWGSAAVSAGGGGGAAAGGRAGGRRAGRAPGGGRAR